MSKVFVAGATGAIGRVLCRLLVKDGWEVHAMTRTQDGVGELRALGVQAVVLDVYERDRLIEHLRVLQPEIVLHMLTDLPKQLEPDSLPAALVRNARIREVGTDNLVQAAIAGKARRLIAQSVAFLYAPGDLPFTEKSPLAESANAVRTLEHAVLSGPFQGLVLRFGRFYGPGTWHQLPEPDAAVHVEAAADAVRHALTRGAPGVYNITESNRYVDSSKAYEVLGFRQGFRSDPPSSASSSAHRSDSGGLLANFAIVCGVLGGANHLADSKWIPFYPSLLLFVVGLVCGVAALHAAGSAPGPRGGLKRAIFAVALNAIGCLTMVWFAAWAIFSARG